MDILAELTAAAQRQALHIKNVVVRQHGAVLARHDFVREEAALLWSVTKSVTSLAVGIALDEGRFQLTDRLSALFPEAFAAAGDQLRQVTIRDLLCMGVGHDRCPVERLLNAGREVRDIFGLFLAEPIVYAPGTRFRYNNTATYMLSRVITATSGESLLDYCDRRIFQPMGIARPRWDTDENGFCLGFSGLHLTASELSALGQLVLDGGVCQGRALVPAGYLREATRLQISTADFNRFFATADHRQGYGYQFWMNSYPGSYRMDGMYGQYVVMLPDLDAVVTFVSAEPEKMADILALTWTTLVDRLAAN